MNRLPLSCSCSVFSTDKLLTTLFADGGDVFNNNSCWVDLAKWRMVTLSWKLEHVDFDAWDQKLLN
jgi:hypothetical protein